jgi:hypothetical protein
LIGKEPRAIAMNWRRGLFWLWFVVSILWIGLMALTFAIDAIVGPHVSNHLMNFVANAFGLPLVALAIGFLVTRAADGRRSKNRNG